MIIFLREQHIRGKQRGFERKSL